MNWHLLSLFLLGFSSLLPLINPIGTALIINPFFAGATIKERKSFALTIIFVCFGLGVATLMFGSWCLKFMGISIATTQMAGGIVIARMGLKMLSAEGPNAGHVVMGDVRSSLFYPISFPLTVGPGVIATLITLSAHSQNGDVTETFARMVVLVASLVAVLIVTFFCYVFSGAVIDRIGHSGSQALNRLMAFVVFCIGIQMIVTGLGRSFPHLFAG